jgi:hypothetical protein
MVTFTKVLGQIVEDLDLVSFYLQIRRTLVSGLMDLSTEMVMRCSTMSLMARKVANILVVSIMDRSKEKAFTSGKMVPPTQESGSIIKFKGWALTPGRTDALTLVIGTMDRCMELACILGQIRKHMRENT